MKQFLPRGHLKLFARQIGVHPNTVTNRLERNHEETIKLLDEYLRKWKQQKHRIERQKERLRSIIK